MSKRLKIAIVVGEVSGDTLGAALIRSFRQHGIDAEFEGIGGPQMIAEGFKSLYPMDTLSVMGLVEVLTHLKSLLAVRDGLMAHWSASPTDVFIGIDAPDFNLRLAKQIKEQQLPTQTVHYVSPSVWAWRQKRVYKIKYAIDLVLCLFPFEVDFYQAYNVAAVFVGHPLARQLPLQSNPTEAKQSLHLNLQQHYIALLPGSRGSEVSRLLPVLLASVELILADHPHFMFIIPAINATRADQIKEILKRHKQKLLQHVIVIENQGQTSNIGRLVMQASDAVILASGTATLEALLLHKPMVVIYKLHWLTYCIANLMVKIPYYSLPNIIANNKIVEELIQQNATPENISNAFTQLIDTAQGQTQVTQLLQLHQQLISDKSIVDPAVAIIKHLQLQVN